MSQLETCVTRMQLMRYSKVVSDFFKGTVHTKIQSYIFFYFVIVVTFYPSRLYLWELPNLRFLCLVGVVE